MVYPLGSILVVRSMTGKNKQAFLEGHTSEISCVAMSSDGTRIVSGQVRRPMDESSTTVPDVGVRAQPAFVFFHSALLGHRVRLRILECVGTVGAEKPGLPATALGQPLSAGASVGHDRKMGVNMEFCRIQVPENPALEPRDVARGCFSDECMSA